MFSFIEANVPSREDLIWDANGGLSEKQIEQFLIVARYLLVQLCFFFPKL